MIYQLVVPGPIEDVEEMRVLEWHGAPGTVFAAGELMVELETHKALVEVRAHHAGILREILCAAGEWQLIGKPLARLSDEPDEPMGDAGVGGSLMAVDFEIS
jgi:pyruvate/2-oxoglutarate dehydrogenase complex dihydrolipoamide acyltransferase (E2) component